MDLNSTGAGKKLVNQIATQTGIMIKKDTGKKDISKKDITKKTNNTK